MKLTYAAPPTDLTPYLSAYYLFEVDEPLVEDIERADVAQVRYFLEGSGDLYFQNGTHFASTPVNIFGPRTKASRITIKGPMRVFGFGLLPAGWAASIALPAYKHVNTVIDGASLFGHGLDATLNTLRALTTVEDMADVLNDIARRFYDQAATVPHWFVRAVDVWLESALSPAIEALEESTGLSRRQIERLTKDLYGAPPKLLVRKYRALRTANAIAHGKGDWQDFIDEGYYDQSHCIRELKEFIGITPNAIRDHMSPLTAMTFDRTSLMGDIATLSALT